MPTNNTTTQKRAVRKAPGASRSTAAKPRTAAKKPSTPRKPAVRRKKTKKRKLPSWLVVLTAIALLLILIAVPVAKHLSLSSAETGAPIPEIAFGSVGIDLSHNNRGPIVWDSLMVMVDKKGFTVKDIDLMQKSYPVKFAFIKATEGSSFKDPEFKKLWQEAGETSITRGAYHFFRSSKDGAVQAKHFISTVGELRHSDLPPVLDIETMHVGCSKKLLNERALQWLKAVEKRFGRKPIVYTSDSYARDILSKEITQNYTLWIAHYDTPQPYTEQWEFWQFTDRALVYGVPEPVDLSVRR